MVIILFISGRAGNTVATTYNYIVQFRSGNNNNFYERLNLSMSRVKCVRRRRSDETNCIREKVSTTKQIRFWLFQVNGLRFEPIVQFDRRSCFSRNVLISFRFNFEKFCSLESVLNRKHACVTNNCNYRYTTHNLIHSLTFKFNWEIYIGSTRWFVSFERLMFYVIK